MTENHSRLWQTNNETATIRARDTYSVLNFILNLQLSLLKNVELAAALT